MSETLTALCNNCGKITDVVYKEKHHPNKIQETYFKCEQCFYHYTCFVKDGTVRRLQHKKDSMTGMHNVDNRLQLQEQINERMSLLKYNLINFGKADL